MGGEFATHRRLRRRLLAGRVLLRLVQTMGDLLQQLGFFVGLAEESVYAELLRMTAMFFHKPR